jgi:hypothetical protein
MFIRGLPNVYSTDPNIRAEGFYIALVSAISETFCSSLYPSVDLLIPTVTDHGLYHPSQYDIDQIPHLTLANTLRTQLGVILNRRKGVGVVVVMIDGPTTSHMCLLVFDGRTRMQHFFNPWGYPDQWVQKAIAERTPFVPGFQVATALQDSWVDRSRTLQRLFDRTATNVVQDRGNCGVLTTMVAVLCMRFDVGDPKLMADIFISASGYPARPREPGLLMQRMWSWIIDLQPHVIVMRDWASTAAEKRAARIAVCDQLFVHSASAVQGRRPLCGVYCRSSSRTCERQACANNIMCWQHRFILKNMDNLTANRRKCSSKQVTCNRTR